MNGVPNRYVLDTSVFIQAFRSYYHFDIAPGFWQALAKHAGAGTLLSIDRVKKEIENGKDELAKWTENHFHGSFENTADNQVLADYQRVIQWVMGQGQYTPAAKAEFADADNADAWIVAYALARGCVVVTQEVAAPQAKRIIKIPDVCRAFSVPCIDTFEMMRKLGIKL
ncbi:MAG: twitching motility protein PilT [Candidatus Kapaibacterium sp.]|nr:MAG: twitching motility protein PilT [Candidatus Kapabacteria bacterium]